MKFGLGRLWFILILTLSYAENDIKRTNRDKLGKVCIATGAAAALRERVAKQRYDAAPATQAYSLTIP